MQFIAIYTMIFSIYYFQDDFAKQKLASSAEVLANLDILIELGQACLNVEEERRKRAPLPIRPSMFGPGEEIFPRQQQQPARGASSTFASPYSLNLHALRSRSSDNVSSVKLKASKPQQSAVRGPRTSQKQLAEAKEGIAALSGDLPSYISAGLNARKAPLKASSLSSTANKKRDRKGVGKSWSKAPWM